MALVMDAGSGISRSCTGLLADGSLAPPLPPLPPPPPSQHDHKPPAKVSRYRSLRGKSISSPRRGQTFDVFNDQDDGSASIVASERRDNAAATAAATAVPPVRALKPSLNKRQEVTPLPPVSTTNLVLTPKSVNVNVLSPASSTLHSVLKTSRPLRGAKSLNFARLKDPVPAPLRPKKNHETPPLPTADTSIDDQARSRKNRDNEEDDAAIWADEVARLEAETDRILAEQKKRDLARLQAQLAVTATVTPTATPKPRPQRLIIDKLGFLSRAGRSNASSRPSTPHSAPAKILAINWGPLSSPGPRSPSPDNMSLLQHGRVDAPTAASNGGDRRVTVRCFASTINLPVNPDTSPVDIAYSTANLVSHKIQPATCIIVECYETLGLERKLRRYERVRDVMNSWDLDKQNSLLILSYDSPPSEPLLELGSVPKTDESPTGFTFQLYHSSRPGKWNKRWITLMDNGQMFATKRPEAKLTDKDSSSLCHLSDFDIYSPTLDELKRQLKPPKPFCYAIKSQQKTTIFPTGENFIHFFCTEEEDLAQRFHELVFGWRSWYLVNKRADLQSARGSSSLRRSATSSAKRSESISRHNSHKERALSGEKTPYTIGEFQPLIDMQRFDKPIDEFGKNLPQEVKPAETPKEPQTPKSSKSMRSAVQSASALVNPQSESDFFADGLLGDGYDKRKQTESATAKVKKLEGPFTEGPSLLNNISISPKSSQDKPEPSSWFPSAAEHSALHRPEWRPSQTRRPATSDSAAQRRDRIGAVPAVAPGTHADSTRARQQSQRSGVGRAVKPPPGAPLINFATGGATPDQAVQQRSNSKAGLGGSSGQSSGRMRSRSTASTRSGTQRLPHADYPPVPPLPHRSVRRPAEATRGPQARPQEPLINRVK